MARIRSVHPGLFKDESFMDLADESPLGCVFLIGIWCMSDDKGAFEWKPRTLKAEIFPGMSCDVAPLLAMLAALKFIAKYEVDGREYGAVRNFGKFQRPKKPNDLYPMPPEWRTYAATDKVISELEGVEGEKEPRSVPYQLPTSGEIPKQMEDGGGRGGEEERTNASHSAPATPAAVAKLPVRDELWQTGLQMIRDATGKSHDAARSMLGRFVREAKDDCGLVLAVLREAADLRPVNFMPWVNEAIKTRLKPQDRDGFLILAQKRADGVVPVAPNAVSKLLALEDARH